MDEPSLLSKLSWGTWLTSRGKFTALYTACMRIIPSTAAVDAVRAAGPDGPAMGRKLLLCLQQQLNLTLHGLYGMHLHVQGGQWLGRTGGRVSALLTRSHLTAAAAMPATAAAVAVTAAVVPAAKAAAAVATIPTAVALAAVSPLPFKCWPRLKAVVLAPQAAPHSIGLRSWDALINLPEGSGGYGRALH